MTHQNMACLPAHLVISRILKSDDVHTADFDHLKRAARNAAICKDARLCWLDSLALFLDSLPKLAPESHDMSVSLVSTICDPGKSRALVELLLAGAVTPELMFRALSSDLSMRDVAEASALEIILTFVEASETTAALSDQQRRLQAMRLLTRFRAAFLESWPSYQEHGKFPVTRCSMRAEMSGGLRARMEWCSLVETSRDRYQVIPRKRVSP